jgi:hypothetical protein
LIHCSASASKDRIHFAAAPYNAYGIPLPDCVSPDHEIDISVIGKTSRRSYRPRSHIALPVGPAHESRPETPTELQPQEGPLIAGLKVLFASREYVPGTARFPERNPVTIKLSC